MQLQFPWFCVGHPECFLVLDHFLFAEVYKLLFIHDCDHCCPQTGTESSFPLIVFPVEYYISYVLKSFRTVASPHRQSLVFVSLKFPLPAYCRKMGANC